VSGQHDPILQSQFPDQGGQSGALGTVTHDHQLRRRVTMGKQGDGAHQVVEPLGLVQAPGGRDEGNIGMRQGDLGVPGGKFGEARVEHGVRLDHDPQFRQVQDFPQLLADLGQGHRHRRRAGVKGAHGPCAKARVFGGVQEDPRRGVFAGNHQHATAQYGARQQGGHVGGVGARIENAGAASVDGARQGEDGLAGGQATQIQDRDVPGNLLQQGAVAAAADQHRSDPRPVQIDQEVHDDAFDPPGIEMGNVECHGQG